MIRDTPHPLGLDAWLERIRERELPIFGQTAEQIRELTDSDKAAVSQLADAILRDPGMTAKLLRIANSAIFNPTGTPITTVSRAVLMLGFNMVRQVALSVAFVDALLRGPVRERVLREMARACHAAAQARWLAVRRHDGQPEEVFIAALLHRFGEMAFWCLAGEAGDELEAALLGEPLAAPDAEQALLGFRLHQLTAVLTRDWRVSPLLQSVLKGGYPKRSREHAVALACRLAEDAEGGWNGERARARMREAADYLQVPPEDIAEAIMRNASEAAAIAECYGAGAATRFIPR